MYVLIYTYYKVYNQNHFVYNNLHILLYVAMKIHVSNSCAQLLLQAGGFELEKRGTIQVKVDFTTNILHWYCLML